MKQAYQLTRQAEEDFLGIVNYLMDKNPATSLEFIDAVEATCNLLSEQPGIGKRVEYIEQHNIRRFHVKHFQHYSLFYRVIDLQVEVVRMCHGSRDLPALFRD